MPSHSGFSSGPSTQEQNAIRMIEYAEIRLEIDLEKSGAHDPFFTVVVSNTSPKGGAQVESSEELFSLDMYNPPTYAHKGNLVVWRNGERLWDIEPTQLEMFVCGFPAVLSIPLYPQTGFMFSFYAHEQFPPAKLPSEAPSIPLKSGWRPISFLSESTVNPFLMPGRYTIRYEILIWDAAKEKGLERRMSSNEVAFVVDEL
ncbi:hypothetical protein P3T73_08860 [Kiritimatiellota bacterium B12222]|nr:hypothetical protein P3T73_08860 [Kiritimatiellota bacterium B12222]